MRWLVPSINSDAVTRLSRALKLSPLIARLLVLRGIEAPEDADLFLHPSLGQLHNPFLMAGMDVAVRRLRQTLERREKILIYGDYDVDGTMAVVVLLTALRSLGADVEAHIPNRLTDGYGMRAPVIEQAAAEGRSLVISVDTGIREHEALRRARELGIDCIVTDHHLPDSELPPACAILNPRRSDCAYPDKNLSGVGVAWKLAQALLGREVSDRVVKSYLKIVAMGTIADVVPLVGENRIIVYFGLQGLREACHPGLQALLDVSALDGRAPSAGDVAFRLAPRLNAAGRMETARDVIDLFSTQDAAAARKIAEHLESLNRERQRMEDQILKRITGIMERHPKRAERYSLVFSGEGWHRGVIGIVAQRVVEMYHRPALVIGVEHGFGQGSGRSIRGFHLLNALSRSSDLFERYGGHAQAAGFTLKADRIGELARRLENYCRARLRPQDLEPILRVDAEISLTDIDKSLFQELQRLDPFGFGNPTPVFAVRELQLVEAPRVLKEKHLKMKLGQGAKSFDALAWRKAGQGPALSRGQRMNVAFTLEENTFREKTALQLIVKDLQLSEGKASSR